jgi:hypothetical protein
MEAGEKAQARATPGWPHVRRHLGPQLSSDDPKHLDIRSFVLSATVNIFAAVIPF